MPSFFDEFLIAKNLKGYTGLNFGDLEQLLFETDVLIFREANMGREPFLLLVVGFRRSENYPSGEIKAVQVETIRDERLKQRIITHFRNLGVERPIEFFK